MISIDRFTQLLNEAAGLLPREIFTGLNLGIGVIEGSKRKKAAASGAPIFILGEYKASHSLGRGILLYYGSFLMVYPDLKDDDDGQRIISDVLKHELTHHLESQAGSRDLEIADAKRLMKF